MGQGLHVVELEKGGDLNQLHNALANDPAIVSVSRVPVRYLLQRRRARQPATSDPPGPMWNLNKIRWAEARQRPEFVEPRAQRIKVAVLDTGVDANHPDLRSRRVQSIWYPDLGVPVAAKDIVGHGTHVTGTIVADFDNAIGIKGICDAEVSVYKIFPDQPHPESPRWIGYYAYLVDEALYLRALVECLEAEVDVINLSIGGGRATPQELQLFNALLDRGTTIVAAMGNARKKGSPVEYPGAIEGVIAVGATSIDDTVADFSSRGAHCWISAPGVGIWSTVPTYAGQSGFLAEIGSDGRIREGRPMEREVNYAAYPGTSMATPHVTAAAAIWIAAERKAGRKPTPAAVRQRLAEKAVKVAGMGGQNRHQDYGFGRLDIYDLL